MLNFAALPDGRIKLSINKPVLSMKKFFTPIFSAALMAGVAMPAYADATTAYGYTLGERNNTNCGFVSFDVNKPQTLTRLKTVYDDYHVSAGEYVDGKLYTFRVEADEFGNVYPYDYVVYDADKYTQVLNTLTGDQSRVVDMTFDYVTNTLYALAEDDWNLGSVGATSLYSIDMATGARTLIGGPGKLTAIDGYGNPDTDGLLTLACDSEGELYAMSQYRYFYKVDKFTGKVTQIGERHNLGTRADFQSMAFTAEGKLMWAQNHPSYGHFVEIDLATGIPGGFVDFRTDYDKLDKLGNDAQVTALNFRDREINRKALKAAGGFTAVVSAPEVHTVVLKWELPATDISGEDAKPEQIHVYRMGTSEPIAVLEGTATTFTDTEAPDGTTVYEILPSNEAGFGYPAFAEVFAGYDQLQAVTNIGLALDGRSVTLSWDAPAATVNGGYADYDNITYNIYRLRGTTEELVATGHEGTVFSETLDSDGNFSYIVEAVSGGITGLRAQSDYFQLQSAATLPYFTGFEDDEDSSPWSTINNNQNNPGWTVAKQYTTYEGKCASSYQGAKSQPADCWLISPAFNLANGTYAVDFYVNGSSYDDHSYDVAVGTDAEDVDSFDMILYSIDNAIEYDADATPKGWKHVELEFEITTPGIYHVAFHDRTTSAWGYATLYLDNVTISTKSSAIDGVKAEDATVTVGVKDGVITAVSAAEVTRMNLFDLQGRMVKGATGGVMDASGFTGAYIVAVTAADGTCTYAKVVL